MMTQRYTKSNCKHHKDKLFFNKKSLTPFGMRPD